MRAMQNEETGRFECWFRAKAFPDLFRTVNQIWWLTFLVTISPALFLTKLYGLEMLWIFGGPMIAAQLLALTFHAAGIWGEMQASRREREKNQN